MSRSVLTMAGLVITAVDVHAAVTRTIRKGPATPMELTSATTVTKPPEEVYAFWRQLDRLPTFMAHLDEVRATDARRSHWKASAPFGQSVEWDAETTDDVPAQRIAWRSLDGADVPTPGRCASNPRRAGAAPRCT
ncbi:SRPBCC family protein [Modestobacter marinus]|uniref:SRPBCC family protein n=1 Tax=Modestobacter marinus TaxID=477641 RepID=UPI001C967C26|nr:SRPBCC family protein [Modestobacter marinus]